MESEEDLGREIGRGNQEDDGRREWNLKKTGKRDRQGNEEDDGRGEWNLKKI